MLGSPQFGQSFPLFIVMVISSCVLGPSKVGSKKFITIGFRLVQELLLVALWLIGPQGHTNVPSLGVQKTPLLVGVCLTTL